MADQTNPMGGQAGTTDQQKQDGGQMIPKSRFDEVYGQLKELQRQTGTITQQLGIQSLDQIPQVIAQINNNFLGILQHSGAAPQVAKFFRAQGTPIPELEALAQNVPQATPQGAQPSVPQGMDTDDPYVQMLMQAEQRNQARIQQMEHALAQKMQMIDRLSQQFAMQQQNEIAGVLDQHLEEAIHKVYPALSGMGLEIAKQQMAGKYLQQLGTNPNLTLDQFFNEANFEETAKETVSTIFQGFGIQPPVGTPPAGPQGQQPGVPAPGQQMPQTVQGNSPTLPDEDTVLEAKKNEIFQDIVAHSAEVDEAGSEPSPAPVAAPPEGG